MSFINKIKQTIDNSTVTDNGMVGYKSTYLPLVDMNFKVASYRSLDDEDITEDFNKVLDSDDSKYTLRFLFYLRDIRNGLGERRLFRVCLNELVKHDFKNKDEIIKDIIYSYIPKLGRFDDLFVFLDTKYEDLLIEYIRKTLNEDLLNMKENKPISLLAKWMPSENTSSFYTREVARYLIKKLNVSSKTYRKTLSSLRNYLKIVETLMSSNNWDKINYSTVPSKANILYSEAFLKNDELRRVEFLNKLASGNKSVKINGEVNYPHDILHAYFDFDEFKAKEYNETLEQLWKNLKQIEGLEDTIVVRDGSYSMTCKIGNTNLTALEVSSALTLYCAERLKGDFKDKFITFSQFAKLIDLSSYKTLKDKIDAIYKNDDCSNTDLENVFDLILKTATDHKLKQEELPKQVLIISDMEFDPSHKRFDFFDSGMNYDSNVIDEATLKYKLHGYELPKLIFWNVNSRTSTIPCKENENGVLLVSGFSTNILEMVLSKDKDLHKAVLNELDKKYSFIPYLEIDKI